jgi:hypothetical protein
VLASHEIRIREDLFGHTQQAASSERRPKARHRLAIAFPPLAAWQPRKNMLHDTLASFSEAAYHKCSATKREAKMTSVIAPCEPPYSAGVTDDLAAKTGRRLANELKHASDASALRCRLRQDREKIRCPLKPVAWIDVAGYIGLHGWIRELLLAEQFELLVIFGASVITWNS